jgi:uncharacterized protein YqhQ
MPNYAMGCNPRESVGCERMGDFPQLRRAGLTDNLSGLNFNIANLYSEKSKMNLRNLERNYIKTNNKKYNLSAIIGIIFALLLIIIAFFIFAIVDPAHADTRLIDTGLAEPNIGGTLDATRPSTQV